MRNANIHLTFGALLAGILLTQPLSAQLVGASAGTVGTAYNYTVLARGFAAIGANPAGLGMPDNEGFTIAILPLAFQQSLDPLSIDDLFDFDGVVIPGSTKEDWVDRITSANGQTGTGLVSVTAFSGTWDKFGLQLTTIAGGRTDLNDDVSELMLFGNTGRTGSPGDFDAEGSSMDGFAVTTLGFSVGIPLSRRWEPGVKKGFSLGATLKQSWGHTFVLAEDGGTVATSDPLGMTLNFPVVHPQGEMFDWSLASGIGLDLGLAIQEGPWSGAVVVENVFNSFEWDLSELVFRSGEAVFDSDTKGSDFNEQQASSAPREVRDRVHDIEFRPVFVLGAAYEVEDNLTLTTEFRQRQGEGLQTGPKSHLGIGMVFTPDPRIPLRAGFSAITEGFQMAGGFGLILGPMHIGFGGLYQTGEAGEGFAGTFAISYGSG
jgi:hypothetical protein